FEGGVDEAYELVAALPDSYAVRLRSEGGADEFEIGVLRGESGEDRVVGAHGVDLLLLEDDEAVGPRRHGEDRRRRLHFSHPEQRGGALDDAHAPAGEIGGGADVGTPHDEHALLGPEVLGGEVDLLASGARDAHGLRDDVDGGVLQRLLAFGGGQDAVVDEVGIAQEVAGDLTCDVDVETGDPPGRGIAVAHEVAAGVEADDQPSALPDPIDRGSGGVRVRGQRGGGIAAVGCGWCGHRRFEHPRVLGERERGRRPLETGGARWGIGRAPAGECGDDAQTRDENALSHWYSFNRGRRPTHTPTSATVSSTTDIGARPARVREARNSLSRSSVRVSSIPSVRAASRATNRAVDSPGPAPTARTEAAA